MDPTARLLAEAMRLSTPERARMAHDLLVSLDEGGDDPAEVEREWACEATARLDEVQSGAVTPEDWDTVRAALRRGRAEPSR